MSEQGEFGTSWDASEQGDQLQPDDTLEPSDLDDPLDEGYAPPDRWSAAEGFGNTAAEAEQGESLEMRLAEEEPDPNAVFADAQPESEWDGTEDLADGEVGDARAGRLTSEDGGYGTGAVDDESDLLASDVGIDGAGASAEEAAVHVVDDPL